MAKAGALSMLAEAAEEFIQLECVRRRNQASLKHRSSPASQFHIGGHKSRLKEKVAQARRHAFLLRADNKAALISIIDNVRELASNGETAGIGGKSSQRNGPSPLERNRFMSWAADIEKILFEFEPSENHTDDSLLRILEHLQFLQDGHMCLAEVAMDARVLIEHWDRSGIFDSESSSEDEDEDDDNDIPDNRKIPHLDPAKETRRHLEQSYAYQNVRQRAAASVIKRNVLIWVRSKASFRERVAEIEVFGRTTEELLKELSMTSAGFVRANPNAITDIFALATGRPKSRYGGSIAFKDLLQFSKYMSIFPVDQALRTVEDVTRRRHLFDSRCAIKIQAVWLRVRGAVRARRLRRAIEERRLQREHEAQAKRDAKESKKRKASEAVKRKVTKPLKRTSSSRSSVVSTALSKLNPPPTPPTDEESSKELSRRASDTIERRKPTSPPVLPIETSSRRVRGSVALGLDDKLKSPASTPRSRQRASRAVVANTNDSDDDTTDVEAAWKSFMDSVTADMPTEEVQPSSTPEEEPTNESIEPPVVLPPMEDTWESWSDDEVAVDNNENAETEEKLAPTKPSTPSTPTTSPPQIKVVVSVNKETSSSDAAARRSPRKDITAPRRNQIRPPTHPNVSAVRPLSSLPPDASLHNHTGPYTGAGQLSLMAPFVDTDRSKKSQPSGVAPERKHLYELDFIGADRMDAVYVHITSVYDGFHEHEVDETPTQSRPKTPETREATPAETLRTNSRRTTIARLRSITGEQEQSARVRSLLNLEHQEMPATTDSQFRDDSSNREIRKGDESPNQPRYIIYGAQGKHIQREVVLRNGTMMYSPLSGPPEPETSKTVELDVKDMKAWHRSTVAAIPQAPHPPPDRFRSRQKKRINGLHRHTITTDIADEIQAIPAPSYKRIETPFELPQILRQSQKLSRERQPGEADHQNLDTPAPDANKQMWKRGGELPELALAQIRDRVGYKPRSFHHKKRVSIIAGRAPSVFSTKHGTGPSTIPESIEELPETMFPVDEEEDNQDELSDATNVDDEGSNDSYGEADDDEENSESGESEETSPIEVDTLHRRSSVHRRSSNGLSEELRQLHLAGRERESTRHRSLLTQFQTQEDAPIASAADNNRRRSKDVNQHKHKQMRRRTQLMSEPSHAVQSEAVDASALLYSSSDDEDGALRRYRLRIKARDATIDPSAPLSDDDDDNDGEEEEEEEEEKVESVKFRLGMTQQERDAAFQKLLTQYLGLLQCAPAEVARRLQVNI